MVCLAFQILQLLNLLNCLFITIIVNYPRNALLAHVFIHSLTLSLNFLLSIIQNIPKIIDDIPNIIGT